MGRAGDGRSRGGQGHPLVGYAGGVHSIYLNVWAKRCLTKLRSSADVCGKQWFADTSAGLIAQK